MQYLVESGEATAAVEVTTAGPPDGSATLHHGVPVASATTVAGVLRNGVVHRIDEVLASGAPNALAPGRYLVLLGAIAASPNTYYLADGMAGSFALGKGGSAYEQCPNYNEPLNIDHGPATTERALKQKLLAALR